MRIRIPRPPVMALVTALAVLACPSSRRDSQPRRNLTFLKIQPPHSTPIDTTLQSIADTTHCLRQMPARVVARGRLRKEVHLGPPGYGETPQRDERDTIVVLVLPRSIPVCAVPHRGDTVAVVHASALQLVYAPRNVLDHMGEEFTVYGRLEEAVWGWHFTNVVLHVDSIPDLPGKPSPQAARTLSSSAQGVAPNKRLKLSARWRRLWWNAQWKSSFLPAAPAGRSLSATR